MDEKRAHYLLDFAEGQGLLDRRGGFTHYEPDMADYKKLMDDLKPYISKRGVIFVFTDRRQSFHVLNAIEDTAYVAKSGFPSRFPGPMEDFVICAASVMGKELSHPVTATEFVEGCVSRIAEVDGMDHAIEAAMQSMSEVPFSCDSNGDLVLTSDWQDFQAGTPRSVIWEVFGREHSQGLSYLLSRTMGEKESLSVEQKAEKSLMDAGLEETPDTCVVFAVKDNEVQDFLAVQGVQHAQDLLTAIKAPQSESKLIEFMPIPQKFCFAAADESGTEYLILPQRTLSRAIDDPVLLSMVKMGMSRNSDMIDACLQAVEEKEGEVPGSTIQGELSYMLAFPDESGLKEEDILRASRYLAVKDMKDLQSAVSQAMQESGTYTYDELRKAIGSAVFSGRLRHTRKADDIQAFLLSSKNPMERLSLVGNLLSTEGDGRKNVFRHLASKQEEKKEAAADPPEPGKN